MINPLRKFRKFIYFIGVLFAAVGFAFFLTRSQAAENPKFAGSDSIKPLFRQINLVETLLPTDKPSTSAPFDLSESPFSKRLELKNLRKFDELISKAQNEGRIRLVVGVNVDFVPEGKIAAPGGKVNTAVRNQRAAIRAAQDDLLGKINQFGVGKIEKFDFIPYVGLETGADALAFMKNSPEVNFIREDEPQEATLYESTRLIGADAAWTAGITGTGFTVAILDSGVAKNHSFLSGKVVSEACYSTTTTGYTSFCPGGASSSTAAGSGVNCSASINMCDHGTHVAGIAAGKGTSSYGVGKESNIIAVQVFSNELATNTAITFPWDQVKGLERIYALRNSYNIAAVNMSLGGGRFTSTCDAEQADIKAAIDNLRSVNIATITTTGNDFYTDAIISPGCISTSISVGSVRDGGSDVTSGSVDTVSSFSNSASFFSLLAPGEQIFSSVPADTYANKSGSSMAAPHVAGSWAVLKQIMGSGATVQQILDRLNNTGVSVTDSRNNITKKRIRLDAAVYAGGNPSLSSYSANSGSNGGNGSFNLTIASNWGWNAISRNGWITTSSGGTGNGTIYYSVAPNDDIYTRTGTIIVAGQTFTITQAPGSCASTLSPSGANPASAGGNASFGVTRLYNCGAWSAIPTVSWITVTSGSGQGGGTVTYSVSANNSASSRTGTISVSGGATFTVTQEGVSCNTMLSPASATVNNLGGTNSFTVSRNSACPGWSAIPTVSWITVTSGATGNGNGTVTYSVSENTGTSQRVGTISVSGASSSFTVTQDPVSCSSYLSQSGTSVGSAAGNGSFSVTRAASCPSWTAIPTVSWVTVTLGGNGTSGNGTVNFSVTENTSSNPRMGTISVSGSSTPFTITQAALSCNYSIAPTGLNVGSGGTNGSTSVTVQNNCAWSASSNANWITITGGASRSGNGTVSFSVAANGSTNSRTGTMTIAGLTFTVTQDGAIVCSYSISPIYYFFTDAGGTTNVSVTAPAGCPWTANTSYSWISIPSGASGNGNGMVTVSALPNPFASFRQALVTIAGNDFSIGQTAAQSFSVTGTISYGTTPVNQTTKFVSSAMLTVSGGSVSPVMTTADGAFGFNLTPNGQYTVTPSKSGEIKGSISSFDATLILRCVAAGNGCAFTPNQRIAGDTNNDNQITSFDATQILRFVAANSQNANTGQVGNWKFTPAAIDYLPLDSSRTNQNFEAILVGEVSGDWATL